MDMLIDKGLELLAGGVLIGVMWLMKLVLSKLRLQLAAETMLELEALARQGIDKAEEWAAAQIKAKLRDKVGGTEKREMAIQHVLDYASKTPTFKTAEDMVMASLPTAGAGATVKTPAPSKRG
jgi:hypothetical protein